MRKALSAYRRTLAIDSENVAAHYGLGLVYNDLARGHDFDFPSSDPNIMPRESWTKAVDRVADPKVPTAERVQAAHALAYSGVQKLLEGFRPETGSRLEPLYEVVEKLGPVAEAETDPALGVALAALLEYTHKGLHRLLKPDETAEGRAVAAARKNDPAADQNAQSIVIHSLHRPGAPGIAATNAAAKVAETRSKEGEE
jgi:hypothetical protein